MREYTVLLIPENSTAVLTIKADDVNVLNDDTPTLEGLYNFWISVENAAVDSVTVAIVPVKSVRYITSREIK